MPENTTLKEKQTILKRLLGEMGSVIIAYSGGVDSSLLACYARQVLQDKAEIVIAVSPSLANEELMAARLQAERFRWDLTEIQTDEVDRSDYRRNDLMRCYFCKSTLFEQLDKLAQSRGIKFVAYGANLDDLLDFRPGHKAAKEHQVRSPLQEACLTKSEVRELARLANLPCFDRPQTACLSSRFPTFVPVTKDSLFKVEQAEKHLHDLGFRQVRVRHFTDQARIELDPAELPALTGNLELMTNIVATIKELGYREVEIDPRGYRQGSVSHPGMDD